MNAERLLAYYERIADAPDAIARLRRFILDLAVRGKLVPQEANDEPASELLKRIAKEKEQVVRLRRASHDEPEPIVEGQEPFPIPERWKWARLGSIADLVRGISFPASDKATMPGKDLVPCLRSGNIQSEIVWGDFIYVPLRVLKGDQQLVREGDILISIANSFELVGKCSIVRAVQFQATFGAFLAAIRLYTLSPEYVRCFLSSDYSASRFRLGSSQTTNIANITFATIRDHAIPLPPLAEQRRIVAKVDELMALCDRLEAARSEREAARDKLAAASLARLNVADPEIFEADARFALEALPALTARADQIKQLRQTILTLAVRGKLVPQDANDEPASELLKRIRAWQRHEIEQKTIRAPRKPLAPVKNDDNPYPRPNGWDFARLGEIIYIQSGDGLTAANMKGGPVPVFGGNGINGYHDQNNVNQPTIVIGRVGYYCGSIHVTPPSAWVTDNAFITKFSHKEIYLRFLVLLLTGTNLKKDENATAQPVISGSKIYPIVVGLPPLAEQHRIVAKVDELLALCDRLEASLTATAATRRRLLDALLAEALAPADDREMEAAE